MTAMALGGAVALLAGCGSSSEPAASDPPSSTTVPTTTSGRCVVRLHGKGGAGAETTVADGVTIVAPEGNGEGWGGRQWTYFPDDQFAAARAVVADAVESCDQIIVNGFSNGGAFAAKLYCRGESFDGRLERVVVDDPVVDQAVEGCQPDPAVEVTLYWTGALADTAQPGWQCSEADWTCEGGVTIGIDAYAEALSTEVLDSPFDAHQWYVDAPEVAEWR
jgi:pimeloyl-ACP methyl ester carboxylesterase